MHDVYMLSQLGCLSRGTLVMLSQLGCLSRGTLRLHTHLDMVSFPVGERGA